MVKITFQDAATEKKALAFLLGRFSGRVLKGGEHLVPEAALEALAESNGASDTIEVSSVPTPGRPGWRRYSVNGVNADPVTGVFYDATSLQVWGRDGDDTITLRDSPAPELSGGGGADHVTLINCGGARVMDLSGADIAAGAVDAADRLELSDSPSSAVTGGAGNDVFRTSGDCGNSRLNGGPGSDDFVGGGIFALGEITGDAGDDIVSGFGDWSGATVRAGDNNDRVDCKAVTGNVNLFGDDGGDKLYGGSGNDTIGGGTGSDWMEGGAGDDFFDAQDGVAGNDVIIGGAHVAGDRALIDAPRERQVVGIELFG